MNNFMDSHLPPSHKALEGHNHGNDNKQFDVVCVGSALLDIYLKSEMFKRIQKPESEGEAVMCVEFGGKVEIEQADVCSGGGGSNNAVSFARKGFKTALIAELGKDLMAATITEELHREGVDCSLLVQEAHEETGASAVLVSPEGGRSVMVYRGAAKMLTKPDIPWDSLHPTWLHISSLGGDIELMEGLMGHARHYGIKVAVNPGKAELEKIHVWGGLAFFKGVELLLLNREEAALLLQQDLKNDQAWEELVITGPKLTIVTDGRSGGRYHLDGKVFPYPVAQGEVVEETGAGDGFGSGVVAGLMKGRPVAEAIAWGSKQAENVVKFMGAKRGLLSLEEIST